MAEPWTGGVNVESTAACNTFLAMESASNVIDLTRLAEAAAVGDSGVGLGNTDSSHGGNPIAPALLVPQASAAPGAPSASEAVTDSTSAVQVAAAAAAAAARPRPTGKSDDADNGQSAASPASKKRKAAPPPSPQRPPGDGEHCSICLDEWTSKGKHRICTLLCGHLFGQSCIERWLKERRSCPQCGAKVGSKGSHRVIPLFLQNLVAKDTGELETARTLLEEERRLRKQCEAERRRLSVQNASLKDQLALARQASRGDGGGGSGCKPAPPGRSSASKDLPFDGFSANRAVHETWLPWSAPGGSATGLRHAETSSPRQASFPSLLEYRVSNGVPLVQTFASPRAEEHAQAGASSSPPGGPGARGISPAPQASSPRRSFLPSSGAGGFDGGGTLSRQAGSPSTASIEALFSSPPRRESLGAGAPRSPASSPRQASFSAVGAGALGGAVLDRRRGVASTPTMPPDRSLQHGSPLRRERRDAAMAAAVAEADRGVGVRAELLLSSNVHAGRVAAFAGGSAGALLVSQEFGPVRHGVTKISLADPRHRKDLKNLHAAQVRDVKFSEERGGVGYVLSTSFDKTVKVCDLRTDSVVVEYGLEGNGWSCQWSATNPTQMFCGVVDGTRTAALQLFDLRFTSGAVGKLRAAARQRQPIHSICHTADDHLFCATMGGVWAWGGGTKGGGGGSRVGGEVGEDQQAEQLQIQSGPCCSLSLCEESDRTVGARGGAGARQHRFLVSTRGSSASHAVFALKAQTAPPASDGIAAGAEGDGAAQEAGSGGQAGDGGVSGGGAEACRRQVVPVSRRPWAERWARFPSVMQGHRSQHTLSRSLLWEPSAGAGLLVAGGDERTNQLWIWDATSGDVCNRLAPHGSAVLDVASLQDGSGKGLFASVSQGELNLYETFVAR